MVAVIDEAVREAKAALLAVMGKRKKKSLSKLNSEKKRTKEVFTIPRKSPLPKRGLFY